MVKLTSLLETVEQTPVTMEFLRKRVPEGVTVVAYPKLKGRHRGDVFKKGRPVVVLIPKKGTKSGHYVVLIPRKHHIEYFSSLGRSPESELQALHEPLSVFRNLLGKAYIYNRTVLQSGKYTINSCGAWVLTRVFLTKLKLREFVELFKRPVSLTSPDMIVAALSLLHFVNKT